MKSLPAGAGIAQDLGQVFLDAAAGPVEQLDAARPVDSWLLSEMLLILY